MFIKCDEKTYFNILHFRDCPHVVLGPLLGYLNKDTLQCRSHPMYICNTLMCPKCTSSMAIFRAKYLPLHLASGAENLEGKDASIFHHNDNENLGGDRRGILWLSKVTLHWLPSLLICICYKSSIV